MAWCRVEFSSQRGHDRGVRLGKRTRGAISLRNGRSLSTEELPTALKRKKGPFKPRRGRGAVPDWGGWLFGEPTWPALEASQLRDFWRLFWCDFATLDSSFASGFIN
jgi:hypothetical protein